jgi:predicted acyl esterase
VTFFAFTGWEAPDPVWWVAQGFAVVNADLRGCGHSDGTGKLLPMLVCGSFSDHNLHSPGSLRAFSESNSTGPNRDAHLLVPEIR